MDLVRNLVIASGIVSVLLAIIHVFVIDSSNLDSYKKAFYLQHRAPSDKTVRMYNSMDGEALSKGNAESTIPGQRIASLV